MSLSVSRRSDGRRAGRTLLAVALALLALAVVPTVAGATVYKMRALGTNGQQNSSDFSVGVSGGALHDSAPTGIFTNQNHVNQKWEFLQRSTGFYIIKNVNSGKCLDQPAPANGTTVTQYRCHNGVNQDWLVENFGNHFRLQNALPSVSAGQTTWYCLDIRGGQGGFYNGSPLQVWQCNGNANQKFWLSSP